MGRIGADWLSSIDHKVIGYMYLIASFLFFALAGIMALVIRAELIQPGMDLVSQETYDQLFTMHGTIMLLLFAGFANVIMPLQIGAPDVAFPRLNAVSFWLFLFGGREIEQNLRHQDRAFAWRMDALNTASARQGPQRFACHTTRHELVCVFLAVVILTALSMLFIVTVGRTRIPPATPVDTAVSENSTFTFVSELTAGIFGGQDRRPQSRRTDASSRRGRVPGRTTRPASMATMRQNSCTRGAMAPQHLRSTGAPTWLSSPKGKSDPAPRRERRAIRHVRTVTDMTRHTAYGSRATLGDRGKAPWLFGGCAASGSALRTDPATHR
ncbi:cbb3-type cytochrome c oxidase subunit I [Nonomuraea sp. NPDC050451]|uniref:cbb3-type cytochrome c oxidase subunit I n=1 Tax=Nonomuraea sp. NPDC050451 TaxID=3364364 RepID=UPI00378FE680